MTDLVWTALALVAKGLAPAMPGATRGSFFVATEADRTAVELCLKEHDRTGLEVVEGVNAVVIGRTVTLSFDPKPGWASVAKDLDELLDEPGNRIRAKSRFLVLDTKQSSDDLLDQATDVGRYMVVIGLVQALKEAAGFLDTPEQNLVFISGGRFDLPVNYTVTDLRKLNLDDVRALTTLIPADTHKKQCAAIFASAITDLVRAQPTQNRFAYLLAHAKELRAAYDQGYKIYAAGFSYEKLKDTVEAARVEFAGKIHKVLSDVQNQLLGIPIATIIVATQMKPSADFGAEFIVNTAVLLGAWVFVGLTLLLLFNQFQTLLVLEGEIKRQKLQLEREYKAVAGSLEDAFTSLVRRVFSQKVILGVISIVVVCGLAMAHWAYSRLTPLAWASVTRIPITAPSNPASEVSAASSNPAPQSPASSVKPSAPVSAANAGMVTTADTQRDQMSPKAASSSAR